MFDYMMLKKIREQRGMSGESLVRALFLDGLCITRQTIFNWEKGTTCPNSKELSHLAYVLDVSVGDFFKKEKTKKRSDQNGE